MLRNDRPLGARAAKRLEQRAARLPAQRVSDRSGWCRKARDVRRDVVRLHHELCVWNVAVAPVADLDIQLTMILLHVLLIPGEHAEGRRGIDGRGIADGEGIGAVAEGARQDHFAAGPSTIALNQRQVHEPLRVDPGIRGIVLIGTAAIARCKAHVPVITAERNPLGRKRSEVTCPACDGNSDDAFSWFRQDFDGVGGMVVAIDQERRVLHSQVDPAFPGRIRFDSGERLRGQRLNPPDARFREQHDPLSRPRAHHPPPDLGGAFGAPRGGRRHLIESNHWFDRGILRAPGRPNRTQNRHNECPAKSSQLVHAERFAKLVEYLT